MRREQFVPGADQVVGSERLHVYRRVRRQVDGVDEDLGTDAVCRGDTCMPVAGQRGTDRAVLIEWTFLIGQ